ncbi:MAG TPA: ABC transporter permease [Mycobacteriales bacterium]|nr:ABC transporter permease [Mycobacteriales bacterium]
MTAILTPANPAVPLARSVRAELRRVLRWPVTWVLLGVWLLLNVLFTYVFDWISYRTGTATGPAEATTTVDGLLPAAIPDVLTQGMPLFGGALVMIMAALAVGSGYGWGTWKTVYTQGPSRVAAFGGTLVALAALVAGLVLVTIGVDLALSAVIAVVEGHSAGLPAAGPLAVSAAGAMLILGMWASLGTAVGVLSRSPALSAGLGLVWSLVVENLLRGVANALPAIEGVTYRLPGSSAGSVAGALGATPVTDGGSPGVLTELSGLAATGLTAGYLVVGVVVALAVVARRDLL